MTLVVNGGLGQGVVVPFKAAIDNIVVLVSEAEALWKAEKPRAAKGDIGASWGCVGLSCRTESNRIDCLREWTSHFRAKAKASPIAPVDNNGVIQIGWPVRVVDGAPLELDLILVTVTKSETPTPSPETVADAWLEQSAGHERYFFENVRHQIRTADDLRIWIRIENCNPAWLTQDKYAPAVAILRQEAGTALA